MPYKIAIATERRYTPPNSPWYDDSWLKQSLESKGHEVEIVGWRNNQRDMTIFDAVYISTCWDIPDHRDGSSVFLSLTQD